MTQRDLFEARRLRDEGMERAKRNSAPFTEQVHAQVLALPCGTEWTGEEIRRRCQDMGINPHHVNAWGAAINHAVRKGLLTKTGEYRQSRSVKNHAHHYPVYRRTC